MILHNYLSNSGRDLIYEYINSLPEAEKIDGYTHVFAEFGTSKMIQIVLPKLYDLKLMTAYQLSGLGYDIKSGNMYFIEQNTEITNY